MELLLIMVMMNTLLLNKVTSENFTAKLKQANLASKSDIANFDGKLKDVITNKNELNELSKKS